MESPANLLDTALLAMEYGINVLPLSRDGTKRPAVPWKPYQHQRVREAEIGSWFRRSGIPGLVFITGHISGGLEALDFDDAESFLRFQDRMCSDRALAGLYARVCLGYLEQSPRGGRHLLYRCEHIEGNQRLAVRDRKPLIETRGEGGILVVAPSLLSPTHPRYHLLHGNITTIEHVSLHERSLLLAIAREFHELPPAPLKESFQQPRFHAQNTKPSALRPGDLFNAQASWEEVLMPHGWSVLYEHNGTAYWTKHSHVHATTNHQGSDLLYVFSTSTPFEPERGYSKFAAYTLLNYGCLDKQAFAESARDLAARGYTTRL